MAGLLGNPLKRMRVLSSADDLNLIDDGIYSYHNTSNPKNYCVGYNCLLIQISALENTGYRYQFEISYNESKFSFRCKSGSWGKWVTL